MLYLFIRKTKKNVTSNYCPISLLPIFGKILEKLMYDSLYVHLVSCHKLNPSHSGFRPCYSAINQLISITHANLKHLTAILLLKFNLSILIFLKHSTGYGKMFSFINLNVVVCLGDFLLLL